MNSDFSSLRGSVADATRAVSAAGLVMHAFGNVSQVDRQARVVAIKPSGIQCDEVFADDVVVVSLDTGEMIWGDLRPSSDLPTHLVLYREISTANAIVHTHSLHATAWAQSQHPLPCLGTTHADHFRGPIPVTRTLTPDETSDDYEHNTGQVIAELFASGRYDPTDTSAVLVASHGPFVWGSSAEHAVQLASVLEFVAQLARLTTSIDRGQVQVGDHLIERHFTRKNGPLAYYGQP